MATLAPLPKIVFFDSNGEPLANGKLYTYEAGTSTPLATYTDSTAGTENTNPVILNSRGEAAVWLGSGTYKFILKDANDATIYTVDNISPPTDSASAATYSNKTFDNTNVITVKDSNFTLQDNADTTKQARFQLSGLATGTTKTLTLPDWSGTVMVSEAETSVASAGTVDLGAVDSNNVLVTGTTGITGFGTVAAGIRKWVRFNNTLTITHNGTSLILPFGRDLVTTDNMTIEALSLGSGNWRVTSISNSTETSKIQPITASVGSNAMTVTLNPTILDFRSATLGSGTVNTRSVGSAISVVIPSTATLGTTSAVANRVAVLAIDNSGTVELAVCNANCPFSEDELISTTAIDTAADSATTIYSTTARSNVPFRFVGLVDSTQATAGTWASAPSKIQGAGGFLQRIVQTVHTQTGAVATGSTQIPTDDTIPQITEGDEYMTLTITPKSAGNKLLIESSVWLANTNNLRLTSALFQDATSNALAANAVYQGTGNQMIQINLVHEMTAGTTSATTFRIRCGADGVGTTTFNGVSGGRMFGGAARSFIRITELVG